MQTEPDLRTSPPPTAAPDASPPAPSTELPESRGYRIKNRLLGPPLNTEALVHERLGKPTALAVFASDNLSSVAYGTEEILTHLVPYVGVAAFALVMPITIALLVVLAFLILSYRQTIKAYPSAGGAYIVTRDNFGLLPAEVAGVALLTDYVLTVAVSVSAGTAALTSVASGLTPYAVPISVFFIAFIVFGNLRGVRESGRMFALPTYFFIGSMVALLGIGIGKLPVRRSPAWSRSTMPGLVPVGTSGSGWLAGRHLVHRAAAFASGGAAVTGVEAISNGVPAFRVPEWRNARTTLVIMGSTLGDDVPRALAPRGAHAHRRRTRRARRRSSLRSARSSSASGTAGNVLYYCLQAGTMLILVLAANTSFADFPGSRASTRVTTSCPASSPSAGTGWCSRTGSSPSRWPPRCSSSSPAPGWTGSIPLYAIGVFTSFTLSQAGMARHHIRLKEPGWRAGLFINAIGALLSLIVDVIIAVTKFKPAGAILGAWVIILLVPIMVYGLTRLNKQYEAEAEELEENAPQAAEAPILRRHVVIVFVDSLDLSAARAIQYARTLMPDELRAVHFDLDPVRTEDLAGEPGDGSGSPGCRSTCSRPGPPARPAARRRGRGRRRRGDRGDGAAPAPRVQPLLAPAAPRPDRRRDGGTAERPPARQCHDRPVPPRPEPSPPHRTGQAAPERTEAPPAPPADPRARPGGRSPASPSKAPCPSSRSTSGSGSASPGASTSLRVQPWAGQPTLECTITDGTGRLTVVFLVDARSPASSPARGSSWTGWSAPASVSA